jgi:predicted RNA-binding protein (virulence factor B family)
MLQLGNYNELEILRQTSVGLYLGDNEGNDVLLPTKYVPVEYRIGDRIRVFVYKDYEQRWIATNLEPALLVNEFAYLPCRSVSEHGGFLMWGLEKDIFVPHREMKQRMEAGQSYIIHLTVDEETNRLIGSTKVNRYLQNDELTVEPGDRVSILIFETTPLGYNAIINNKHKGLLYHNEVFQTLRIGDTLSAYVKLIREDNSIDLSLQPKGIARLEEGAERILTWLKGHQGFLPLTDNSSPEEIQQVMRMSKKNFKKSIGILFKQKLVLLEKNGVKLVS